MAIEDFTLYTEADPNSRIAVTGSRVTWTALTRDEDAYVYADKGAGYFAGNFSIELTYRANDSQHSGTIVCALWSIANLVDDLVGIDAASGDYLALFPHVGLTGAQKIILEECDGGTLHNSSISSALTEGTDYYLRIIRDETVVPYGTLYCYIYTDIDRTTLHGSALSVALNTSKKDFRYLYACHSMDTNEASITHSGYTEALELIYNVSAPSVTTQACSSISGATATGNGTITSIGSSSVTQHGHCWTTSIDPTIANSKTSNGAGSLGTFTSSITGLTQGLKYYFRAYATNTTGTAYGGNTTFTAGKGGTQLIEGNVAVVQTRLHYVGTDGKERYIEGSLV